jgi:polysaccharide pyruvyl transferase WcaK-like protein
MKQRTKIVIAGETYSTNLGDGVIAQCLAYVCTKSRPAVTVAHADISGHTGWSNNPHPQTRALSRISLPSHLNNMIRWRMARRQRCLSAWHPILENAAALLIGGGQLLMDNQLDFPLKISELVHQGQQREIPIHIIACGVNPNWSPRAARLFHQALAPARSISVRDRASLESLHKLEPALQVTSTSDPAIWAAELYGAAPEPPRTDVIGLGIISVEAMNRRLAEHMPEDRYYSLWRDIIIRLQEIGWLVELFTNGTPNDQSTAQAVAAQVESKCGIRCPVASRPRLPEDLAHLISRYRAIIATRLHASIIATSYGIPVISLSWDKKVQAFYQQTNRPAFALDITTSQPVEIVETLLKAIGAGIASEVIENNRYAILSSVDSVMQQLE